ncbi:hypothetical protein BDV93DRAFT_543758 [Ceratobasidium sp. AG-I]|nr:hypothetical protein BDV93DRAFT_543758 [Ceratobasidium sp. AG-I]
MNINRALDCEGRHCDREACRFWVPSHETKVDSHTLKGSGLSKPSNNAGTETSTHTKLQLRVAGYHYMLQNAMLISLIAFTVLIFSKIEGWTYVQGIYFTTVTVLTIGFGNFYPTKPSTKIPLFPLGPLGITLLASSISMIVSFFNKHQREHKARARARAEREKAWHIS